MTTTPTAPAWTTAPATEKQLSFIRKLDGQRDVPVAGRSEEEARILETIFDVLGNEGSDDPKFVSKGEASAAIGYLLDRPFGCSIVAAPASGEPAGAPVSEAGVYEANDRVYMVVKSGAGRFYAKVLTERLSYVTRLTEAGEEVHATFEYESGAIREISAADRVTPERAKELGHLTTFCCVCGTKLEDAKSVAAGIGPTCAKKYR
jgi:hypothetical protein